jgi:hypothetical protein
VVDGLEGDDHFTVQSTPFGVATRIVGGLGNDSFNVASDVTDIVTTQELEGQSAVINHQAASIGDIGYDGLIVPGINLSIAGLPGSGGGSGFSGNVIIDESDGSSLVRETASGTAERSIYTVRLAVPVAAGTKVYVTVSAARSPQEEQHAAGMGDSVLVSTDPGSFVRNVLQDGVATTVRNRAVVLVFDSSNWNQAQTVYVAAANDSQEEGKRDVAVSQCGGSPTPLPLLPRPGGDSRRIQRHQGATSWDVIDMIPPASCRPRCTDSYHNGTLVLEALRLTASMIA